MQIADLRFKLEKVKNQNLEDEKRLLRRKKLHFDGLSTDPFDKLKTGISIHSIQAGEFDICILKQKDHYKELFKQWRL